MEDRDMFLKIHENETNENTALILMLGDISGKLTNIIDLLKIKKTEKNELTPEDYME